jgi:hypothetical protein
MFDEASHDVILRESDGVFLCRRCGLINPGDEQSCVSAFISTKAYQELDLPKAA